MTPFLAEDRAFERLYQRHAADVHRYALGVVRDLDEAEDVTQTTFLNAFRSFRAGERPRAPRSWLIAIARNVCRQRHRQAARRPLEVVLNDDLADLGGSDEAAPRAEDIRRALLHLSFRQRSALVLRELEGRSYGEIAERLGLSVSAVETLVFRARRALREQLESSLTCAQAQLVLASPSTAGGRGPLRAHLRGCETCRSSERRQRLRRAAFRGVAGIPFPGWLTSLWGESSAGTVGTAIGGGLAGKAAVVLSAGAVLTGVGLEGSERTRPTGEARSTAPASQGRAARGAPGPAVAGLGVAEREERPAQTWVRPGARKAAEGASRPARLRSPARRARLTRSPRVRSAERVGTLAASPPGRPARPAAKSSRGGAHTGRPSPPGQTQRASPARPKRADRHAKSQTPARARPAKAQGVKPLHTDKRKPVGRRPERRPERAQPTENSSPDSHPGRGRPKPDSHPGTSAGGAPPGRRP